MNFAISDKLYDTVSGVPVLKICEEVNIILENMLKETNELFI